MNPMQRSVFDPERVDPTSPRAARMGVLRGLLDASPVGLGDLVHGAFASLPPTTLPGLLGRALGMKPENAPGEVAAGLLGVAGEGPAYEAGRSVGQFAPVGLLGVMQRAAPRRAMLTSRQSQAGVLNPSAIHRLQEILGQYDRKGPTSRTIREAIDLTPQQRTQIESHLSEQFGRHMPVPSSIDLKPRHGYESRVLKDGFSSDDLLRWFVAGADDSAKVVTGARGRIGLLGRDPGTATSRPADVRLTVRGDAFGNVYADDVIPEGVWSKGDLRKR